MLEDIRLTPQERFETIDKHYKKTGEVLGLKVEEAIANTATDKAIKKIDELLIFCKRDVGGINPEWAICDRNYQELKKLVERVAPEVKE